jgi:hypothetical protein
MWSDGQVVALLRHLLAMGRGATASRPLIFLCCHLN